MSCHCIIKHPETKEQREAISQALEYARKVGDARGIALGMAQLTGDCPGLKTSKGAKLVADFAELPRSSPAPKRKRK